jgi:hypothetical protein
MGEEIGKGLKIYFFKENGDCNNESYKEVISL